MTRAFTLLEALMQTTIGEEPEPSILELLPLRDVLLDAIDKLDRIPAYIFSEHVVHRTSYRRLAEELAKKEGLKMSHVTVLRIKQRAALQLQEILKDDPLIKEYLNR